jgi:UDP-N-acetylglucosamine 2-epimerase (non-hydrolysing)
MNDNADGEHGFALRCAEYLQVCCGDRIKPRSIIELELGGKAQKLRAGEAMSVCHIVGARPNFMKMAPIVEELQRRSVPQKLVHTGQHYDANMSKVFFDELGMPEPDIYLGIGSDSHARQTARIMTALEEVFLQQQPSLVVVAGDVNSTVAAALVAAKLLIPVAHVEAGLRSFDRAMPEEVNRVVVDHLSDLLFTTEESGNTNLRHEGINDSQIHFVGNCMVDTLVKHRDAANALAAWRNYDLGVGEYGLLTLHRPSNVDDVETLAQLIGVMNQVAARLPVLFPVHPRTRERLQKAGVSLHPNLKPVEPLPYLTFLSLMSQARVVLTDSGGIQEETSALGVPCLTLRENTERPVTISLGTNRLVGNDPAQIIAGVDAVLTGQWQTGIVPPLWDGFAHRRIADTLEQWLNR